MLFTIKYKLSVFNYLLKYYSLNKISKRYEVYVLGHQIMNDSGKCIWNGTGPARNAIRLFLDRISYNYNQKNNILDVDYIMTHYVGLDDSYPIHIKKVN